MIKTFYRTFSKKVLPPWKRFENTTNILQFNLTYKPITNYRGTDIWLILNTDSSALRKDGTMSYSDAVLTTTDFKF